MFVKYRNPSTAKYKNPSSTKYKHPNYLFLTIGIYSIIINGIFLTLYLRSDTTFGKI
jgi:hypothetical protein